MAPIMSDECCYGLKKYVAACTGTINRQYCNGRTLAPLWLLLLWMMICKYIHTIYVPKKKKKTQQSISDYFLFCFLVFLGSEHIESHLHALYSFSVSSKLNCSWNCTGIKNCCSILCKEAAQNWVSCRVPIFYLSFLHGVLYGFSFLSFQQLIWQHCRPTSVCLLANCAKAAGCRSVPNCFPFTNFWDSFVL